jgi:hypothetical protein
MIAYLTVTAADDSNTFSVVDDRSMWMPEVLEANVDAVLRLHGDVLEVGLHGA